MSIRVETKCLLRCLLRYLYYFLIFKELTNCKSSSFVNAELYEKSFNTKIKEFNMFVNKTNNKLVNNYCLLSRLIVRVGFSPKSKTRPESYIYLDQVLTQYS